MNAPIRRERVQIREFSGRGPVAVALASLPPAYAVVTRTSERLPVTMTLTA